MSAAETADGATVVGVAALASGAVTAGGATASGATAGGAGSATAGGATAGGAAGSEESALLEFIHPALALTGLTFWIFFVVTNGRWFAWIAFGVVVAAILVGLGWALSNWRKTTARDRPHPGSAATPQGTTNPNATADRESTASTASTANPSAAADVESTAGYGGGFPGHLVLAHGLAAACTLALVVISAIAATAHP
jgi:hypothetical protein